MKNFFTGGKIKILLHLLAWSIILGLPLYFFKRWDVGKDFMIVFYIGNAINGIIFYTNYIVLVPRFFFSTPKYRYYLSVFVLLLAFYFVSDRSNEFVFNNFAMQKHEKEISEPGKGDMERMGPGPEPHGRPPYREMHVFNYTLTSMFLIFFSLGMKVLERHAQTEKLQKELEREKLNSELAFLKNQISPHFFFNTLNNIYSLISINQDDSQKAVLKLSKLMRYLLYDSEHGDTLLSSEIDFMNNYIDLMKLRMSSKISLDVDFPQKYDDISIPPLIFIPFIENAFKHGISYREKSFIRISLKSEGGSLNFNCVNSLIHGKEEKDSEHSGIGLENAKKRLNLLFPAKHNLAINRSDSEFEVQLVINYSS